MHQPVLGISQIGKMQKLLKSLMKHKFPGNHIRDVGVKGAKQAI